MVEVESHTRNQTYDHESELGKLRIDITELRKELSRQRDDLQQANLRNSNQQD